MGTGQYTPSFLLAAKALVWSRLDAADDRYPRRHNHGVRSDVDLVVTATRSRVWLAAHHSYTSGHMWVHDDDDDPVLEVDPRDSLEPLRPHIGDDGVLALRAVLDDPARWTPEVVLGLFHGRRGAAPDDVARAVADVLELGGPRAGETTVPYLTLRLLRDGGREIVLDHSFVHPHRVRRLEPVAVPADDDAIVARFGEEVLAAVRLHEASRGVR